MVEEQLVNGDGQINIGRRLPLGEIRGMWEVANTDNPSPLEHLSLSPSLLSSFKFMAIFHSEAQALQVSGIGLSRFCPRGTRQIYKVPHQLNFSSWAGQWAS